MFCEENRAWQDGSAVWLGGPLVWQNGSAVWLEAPLAWQNGSAVWLEAPAAWQNGPAVWLEAPAVWQNGPAVRLEAPAVWQNGPATPGKPRGATRERVQKRAEERRRGWTTRQDGGGALSRGTDGAVPSRGFYFPPRRPENEKRRPRLARAAFQQRILTIAVRPGRGSSR